jgi:uncharacterized DUF497 family protein
VTHSALLAHSASLLSRFAPSLVVYTHRILHTRFEWDSAKAELNRQLHGIAFEDAARIFDGSTLDVADTREDYDENRFIAIGMMFGIEIVVVYATRGEDVIRLIPARKATRHERQAYWENLDE